MKRFTAAAVAAATALSLVALPAQADEVIYLRGLDKPGGSSAVTDEELAGYAFAAGLVYGAEELNLTNNKGITSSIKNMLESENGVKKVDDASEGALKSSFKNDAQNGYPLGTTFEILLGTGITAVVLLLLGGAAYSGVIPGVQLPF